MNTMYATQAMVVFVALCGANSFFTSGRTRNDKPEVFFARSMGRPTHPGFNRRLRLPLASPRRHRYLLPHVSGPRPHPAPAHIPNLPILLPNLQRPIEEQQRKQLLRGIFSQLPRRLLTPAVHRRFFPANTVQLPSWSWTASSSALQPICAWRQITSPKVTHLLREVLKSSEEAVTLAHVTASSVSFHQQCSYDRCSDQRYEISVHFTTAPSDGDCKWSEMCKCRPASQATVTQCTASAAQIGNERRLHNVTVDCDRPEINQEVTTEAAEVGETTVGGGQATGQVEDATVVESHLLLEPTPSEEVGDGWEKEVNYFGGAVGVVNKRNIRI